MWGLAKNFSGSTIKTGLFEVLSRLNNFFRESKLRHASALRCGCPPSKKLGKYSNSPFYEPLPARPEGFVFKQETPMDKKSYPTSLFIFVLVILIFQVVAEHFYWYWRIWWFDMPMHFAGGLWVGLSVLWFVFLSGRFKRKIGQNTASVFCRRHFLSARDSDYVGTI